MSTISRRILATATATAALSMSAMLGTAIAETPGAPTPTLDYQYYSPDGPGDTGYWMHGEGCIGSDGVPGTITAYLTTDDGTVDSPYVTVGDDGHWQVVFLTDPQTGGTTVTAVATCDLYSESIDYPVVATTVPQPPTDLPPLQVLIPEYPDGPGLYVQFDKCFDPDTREMGDVWFDVQAPSGMQSGFVLDDPFASGLLGEPFVLEEGHWVVNAMCRLEAPYVTYDTMSFDLVNNGGTWSIVNLVGGVTFDLDNVVNGPGSDGDNAGTGTPGAGTGTAGTGKSGTGTTTAGGTKAGGTLADTGTDAAPLLAVGGALLIGGAGLLVARRLADRRRGADE